MTQMAGVRPPAENAETRRNCRTPPRSRRTAGAGWSRAITARGSRSRSSARSGGSGRGRRRGRGRGRARGPRRQRPGRRRGRGGDPSHRRDGRGRRRGCPRSARVNRRPGSPLLSTLDRARRDAAATYALAVEIVASGGLCGGGGFAEDRVDGGRGASEGRQFQAVAWAEKLRRLDAAIGGGFVRLNCEGGTIGVHALVRAVAVGGLSLPRVLASLGLCRSRASGKRDESGDFRGFGADGGCARRRSGGGRRKKPLTTEHARGHHAPSTVGIRPGALIAPRRMAGSLIAPRSTAPPVHPRPRPPRRGRGRSRAQPGAAWKSVSPHNIREVERDLSDFARRQLPFATSLALNETAEAIERKSSAKALETRLDRPTPFTLRGLLVLRSSKARLWADVLFKDAQAAYLRWQETGGERPPRRRRSPSRCGSGATASATWRGARSSARPLGATYSRAAQVGPGLGSINA